MTTSNDYQDPTVPTPLAKQRQFVSAGEHWFELTATLSAESTAKLADWIDEDLAALSQWTFVSQLGKATGSRSSCRLRCLESLRR